MDCLLAAEMLNRRMDGELNRGDQARLEEHLARCPACRELEARLGNLGDTFVALAEANSAVLERHRAAAPIRAVRPKPLAGWPVLSGLAAAACIGLLVWVSSVMDYRPVSGPIDLVQMTAGMAPPARPPAVRLMGESRKRYLTAEVDSGVKNVRLVYVFPVATRRPPSATRPAPGW